MAPLRIRFAAAAALLAAHLGLPRSTANEFGGDMGTEDLSLAFRSFFGDSGMPSFDQMVQKSVSSLMSFLEPMKGISAEGGASLSLSLPEDDKSCKLRIHVGLQDVTAKDLKLGLHPSARRVTVSFHKEHTEEKHDAQRGGSRSSRTVHMQSSLVLPARCMATASVLLSSLAGYLVDSEGRRGLVVFPSLPQLQEYADAGLLPDVIADIIERGDQEELSKLSPNQMCLAAGFTEDDCNKLGNKKPAVASVTPAEGDSVPIPLYSVALEQLD